MKIVLDETFCFTKILQSLVVKSCCLLCEDHRSTENVIQSAVQIYEIHVLITSEVIGKFKDEIHILEPTKET